MTKIFKITVVLMLIIGVYFTPSFAEKEQKFTGLPNQAYVELHKSYKQCRKTAKNQRFWQLATECIANGGKSCLNRTSHQMMGFTEKDFSLSHCHVLKPSKEQLQQRLEELRNGEP